jgi:polar amino acid transport system substrate-binding protein
MIRRRPSALALAAAVLALAACSTTSKAGPNDVLAAMDAHQQAASRAAAGVASSGAGAATAAAAVTCSPSAEASYPALGSLPAATALPAGSFAARIRAKGVLVVGVSGDTRLLGARNALKKYALEGFDIELAKAIGRAIFGVDGKVQFKVITAGDRFTFANNGTVDLVARAVSMTCDRWQNTDDSKAAIFSAGYFKSDQRLLVRDGSGITRIQDLKSPTNRVCAPTGSTSVANLAKFTNVTPVSVEIHSDCMALWQEGRVDAITGDDAILAGFAAQDPHAAVVGGALDSTYYAFAIGRKNKDFVQFVNAVMATPAFRSTWTDAYDAYLAVPLKSQPQTQPAPNYNRPLGS